LKIAVVTFPGSNCDEDAVHVARDLLRVDVSLVWHKETSLPPKVDVVILPGGFSYGDALRSGALARFSPIMSAVKAHADRGGFVFGICNGFQILVEAGMLPGAMLQNASQKFVSKNVVLNVTTTNTPFTSLLAEGDKLTMPVAHHEGRYYAGEETLRELAAEDRIVFQYEGENPNGAIMDIAGIVNKQRNVLGMMPHPERACETVLGSTDGLGIFRSIKQSVERKAS
jgi:phosphoribosylformylglycinamidine synthase subunit PurQ / glutaminase